MQEEITCNKPSGIFGKSGNGMRPVAVLVDEGASTCIFQVAEVTRVYGIAQSTIYLRFKTGQLTKYKQNGLTFVDVDELEQSMTEEKLCAVLPEKAGKEPSKR